jgi:hypothetical protein
MVRRYVGHRGFVEVRFRGINRSHDQPVMNVSPAMPTM